MPYKQFLAKTLFSTLFTGPTFNILYSLLIVTCYVCENVEWPFSDSGDPIWPHSAHNYNFVELCSFNCIGFLLEDGNNGENAISISCCHI